MIRGRVTWLIDVMNLWPVQLLEQTQALSTLSNEIIVRPLRIT